MKTVAFIESNFTGVDAIRSAVQAGYKCYLLTSDYEKLKAMLPYDIVQGLDEVAEIINVANSDDVDELEACIRSMDIPVSAVTTFSQFRLLAVAKLAQRLGLRGTSPAALATAIDKYALRDAMRAAGAPSIRFLALSSTSDVKTILKTVGLPCILKPARGHSSLGVQLVRTEQELLSAIVRNRFDNAQDEIIVEEYLEGPLFSLETMTTGPGEHFAWGFSDRVLTHDFIEMGATFPANTPDAQAGFDLVRSALDAIGFDFGTCHTEMIYTSKGPRIVEINPRPGGSGLCRLVQRATGHDVVLDTVLLYLGTEPKKEFSYRPAVTMRSVLPPRSGQIESLPSREDILRLPGVKDVWFQRRVGDLTDDSRSNFSWIVTVLAEADLGRTSVENADEAARWVEVRIRVKSVLEQPAVTVGA